MNDETRQYTHFLHYGLWFDLWDYLHDGTDLYYAIDHTKLYIRKVPLEGKTFEATYLLDKVFTTPLRVLEDFMIRSFWHIDYEGEQVYIHSDIFTEADFARLMKLAVQHLRSNRRTARKLYAKTPLVKYCQEKGLHPEPVGDTNHGQWTAYCPSKWRHHIMINAKTQGWGCGYCGKSGGLAEMQAWVILKETIK